ncbi:MAG: hypothetical protein EHM47_15915 [Ignavibacteriales bacterium]|nr:MAG: hypothetical protein EHM47_15915 [Ignavibacteriales bacterium]
MKTLSSSLFIILIAWIILLPNLSFGIDNSKFFGTYTYTEKIGDCEPQIYDLTISDSLSSDMMIEKTYKYNFSKSYDDNYRDSIVVEGLKIFWVRGAVDNGYLWNNVLRIVFSANRKKAKVTGMAYQDNPEYCAGPVTGTLIKRN